MTESTDVAAARLQQPVIPDSVSAIRRAKMAPVPSSSGWYWIEDDELVKGTPWSLCFLNRLGDEHSGGKPVLYVYETCEDISGRPGAPWRYEFCWDGEDWVSIGDAYADVTPLRWVPIPCPG